MFGPLRPAAATFAAASGAVLALTLAAAPAAEAASAPAVVPAACATSFPIVVDGFAFAPGTVAAGASSTADLITTNCSTTAVATTEMWTGQWLPLSAAGGVPAGCPIIDPLVRAVDYTGGAIVAENTVYTVPSGCSATQLQVTVRIYGSNGVLGATATAVLQIAQATPGS